MRRTRSTGRAVPALMPGRRVSRSAPVAGTRAMAMPGAIAISVQAVGDLPHTIGQTRETVQPVAEAGRRGRDRCAPGGRHRAGLGYGGGARLARPVWTGALAAPCWALDGRTRSPITDKEEDTDMVERKSDASWQGDLKSGKGEMALGSGAYKGGFSFDSRFQAGSGTNPEELIAASLAGCYAMALSNSLASAGYVPDDVRSSATAHLEQVEGGFAITRIDLKTEAKVPGIDAATFKEHADSMAKGCPVAKALSGTRIEHDSRLV